MYGGVELPWEFDPEYRLRNIIYPAVLSVPLFILKWLHLDFNMVVVLQPYVTHAVLVIAADLLTYKIAKKTVGEQGARISVFLLFSC